MRAPSDSSGPPPPGSAVNAAGPAEVPKKIEARFLRSQRMESIGTLATGIAHDLNNVLAPILLSVGTLRQNARDKESLEMLDLVEASAQRGARLVRQILSFSRGVECERVLIQPQLLAREIGAIISDTFPKNIRFAVSHPADLWTLSGDPTHLHQIMMNLCVNARDAMPGGGLLNLELENVDLEEADVAEHPEATPGTHVLIRVTDTGTGIHPTIRDRIFEPFFTTKEPGHGTGLGLSTIRAIIKGNGGFITCASELGTGSVFSVYLPTRPRKAPGTAAGQPPSGRG